MLHARIQRLVFACADPRSGAAGSVINLLGSESLNHRVQVEAGILAGDEVRAINGLPLRSGQWRDDELPYAKRLVSP